MNIDTEISELEAKIEQLKAKKASTIYPKMIPIAEHNISVSETPITAQQYELFCTETDREFPTQPKPHNANNPIVNVTYHDAVAYCEWLSKKTGQTCQLPSTEEFLQFCGDHIEGNKEIAVFGQDHIQPVATKQPNKYGLYDVLGLTWEWQRTLYIEE